MLSLILPSSFSAYPFEMFFVVIVERLKILLSDKNRRPKTPQKEIVPRRRRFHAPFTRSGASWLLFSLILPVSFISFQVKWFPYLP